MEKNNILIGTKLLSYLSEKIISDMRESHFEKINELGDEILSNYKLVDALREKLNKNDLNILLKGIESDFDQMKGLFITLLKNYIDDPKVSEFLEKRWLNARDFKEKNRIMFRLLEVKDLDTVSHNQFYEFINKNWEDFLFSVKNRCDGEEHVMHYVVERLENKSFPEDKNWVYLCCSLASNDKEAIRNLLNSYKDEEYPLGFDIVETLKSKITDLSK